MTKAAIQPEFISNYQRVSDYRVAGLPGRVSWRSHNAVCQAFYCSSDDPQLLGTVVNGTDPVSDDVLGFFQRKQDELWEAVHGAERFFLKALTTAKWYPHLGWVRCEPAAN